MSVFLEKGNTTLNGRRRKRVDLLLRDARSAAKKSGQVVKQTDVFMYGNSKKRTKRFLPASLGIPLLGSVLDFGTASLNAFVAIVGRGQDAELFKERFESLNEDVKKNSKDIYDFKGEQYSFNLKVRKHQKIIGNIGEIKGT